MRAKYVQTWRERVEKKNDSQNNSEVPRYSGRPCRWLISSQREHVDLLHRCLRWRIGDYGFHQPVHRDVEAGREFSGYFYPEIGSNSDPNPGFVYALSAVNLSLNWISAGSVQVTNLSCFQSNCQSIPFLNASSVVPMTVVAGGTTVVAPGIAGPISGTASGCRSGYVH